MNLDEMGVQDAYQLLLDVEAAEARWGALLDEATLSNGLELARSTLLTIIEERPATSAADLLAKAVAFDRHLENGQSLDDPDQNHLAPDVARRAIAELRAVAARMGAPKLEASTDAAG